MLFAIISLFCRCYTQLYDTRKVLHDRLNTTPLSPSEAVEVVSAYRQNPSWALIDVPQDRKVMQKVWQKAGGHNFARRRIHDMRLAETLKYWGVTEFYTRNTKDFLDAGFENVINPFETVDRGDC